MTRRRDARVRLPDLLALEPRRLLTTLIAIVDSGVDLNDSSVVPYLDLTSAYDAYNERTYAQAGAQAILDTSLTHGHGSVVANMTVQGIVAAAAASSRPPDVKIMPIRDTSSGLNIDPNAVIRGIFWAADHGASVINLSVNFTYNASLSDHDDPRDGSTLVDAIAYAQSKGAIVVTAPGNAARSIELIPVFPPYADDPLYSTTRPTPTNVLVAAAVDANGVLTPVSSWGAVHVDLGAYSGPEGATSYSAAYASGVAGVVADLLPDGSSPRRVLDVLESTVTPTSQTVGAWSKTGGVLNPAAAVARAVQPLASADGSIVIDAGAASDVDFQGGAAATTTAVVDLGGIPSPPDATVFQTARQGSAFSYAIDGLTPGSMYHVRLDFSETRYDGPGQRLFDVLVNGVTQISALDVFAAAGGENRATARDLIVQADGSGRISLAFKGIRGDATVDAIEVSPSTDIAAGKPATSSSIESWSYNPALGVDFSPTSRWSSGQWMQSTSTAWYAVDLQDFYTITDVRLDWERAYAVDFQIQVSDDGRTWTTIKTVAGNQAYGVMDLSGLSGEGRFLRIYCTQTSAGSNNYSLFDLQVSGSRLNDLAQGATATATSSESSAYTPPAAFDNDATTRWSSGQWMQGSQSAWLTVDLGSISAIRDVRLVWEAAYAADYQIQSSVDGKNWTTLQDVQGTGVVGPAYFPDLGGVGRYVRILCLNPGPINDNYSLYDFNVYGEPLTNLATGKVATSSTNESNFYAPSMAVDANPASRWSSGQWMQNTTTGWLAIDLGAKYDLGAVVLNWEAAYAVDYQIQVSDDGQDWTTIRSVVGNAKPGVDIQGGLSGSGRFVRIECTRLNWALNYSLYDVQIFGSPTVAATTTSAAVATADSPAWSTWTASAAVAPVATAPLAAPTPTVVPASLTVLPPPIRRALPAAAFAIRSPRVPAPAPSFARVGRPGLRTSRN
ncbi:discoidin domain-containing protein [Paludisphaera mucosa]|uniref:Discoidin domain-containing protein n=1 Tax=Paludisphaera mucosa TaxID=3030827 RepID=A0ABT6FGQ9_9BACT|nr:discoidin domain-containing protein [Paludisphaera mucosa]MDG3006740.1 discoidin domain-containing protein [Paludisphaera mucosa]